MAFGQDFLKAFFGNDYVKDYRHASKTFRTNAYANAPRYKFLFHVYFNLNTGPLGIPALSRIFAAGDQSTIGLLVKNIDLPKFTMEVDTMNQYNRKRLVQKKVNYQPVTATFHDDGGDLIRTLWYNYYAYYYKDPSQPYRGQVATNSAGGPSAVRTTGFNYNNRDIYANDRFVNDWGYIGEAFSDGTNSAGGKPPFFRDISIYGFNQHKFVEYVLINPMITEWNHDRYDYSQSDGVMENTMTIQYETVKYYTGAIGGVRPDTNVQGFADPNNYDQTRSALSRPGGTQSIFGQGGLLDTGIGFANDLQNGDILGAGLTALTAYNQYKNTNFKQIASTEVRDIAVATLQQTLTSGGVRNQGNGNPTAPVFPTPPRKP